MTSVPPLSSHSLNEPPPWYDGDNPTVPNPVYRDSGDEERAAAPAGPSSGATEEPPKKKDDVGRRGNMVMGAMLVAGMVVVGAAFAMVSGGSDTPGDTADNQVAADSAGSADQALAVASPGDAGGDDGGQDGAAEDADETESGDGSSEAGASPRGYRPT